MAAAQRIRATVASVISDEFGIPGDVQLFGSFSTGFKTSSSDVDMAFCGGEHCLVEPAYMLASLATRLPDLGFDCVTRIFQASIPLVKFRDIQSGVEVDFCFSNELGLRNSGLLDAYCRCDRRVVMLGRLVKEWAKRHDLVGTADGCLNSYAYILLVIHYLQSVQPPVVPNLQQLAQEPVPIVDGKWGCDDCWDTKFFEDVSSLQASENDQTISELLTGFFDYYGYIFDWQRYAVCMRLNRPGIGVDKFSLVLPVSSEMWYIEDPFDLKHNLANASSPAGRERIWTLMQDACRLLQQQQASASASRMKGVVLAKFFPDERGKPRYLKCRISRDVTPQSLIEHFTDCNLVRLHFPHNSAESPSYSCKGQVFFEFASSSDRRRAHAKNESYVASCQLQLHYASMHGLVESQKEFRYSVHECIALYIDENAHLELMSM
jgi:DNA polymerase sigma